MLFLALTLLVLAVQALHRRLLRQVLPDPWRRHITPVLVLLHVPLAAYMGMRLFGFASLPGALLLRPLARAGLYFQVFTLIHLLVWGLASAAWALRRWMREAPDLGPADPARRAFLRNSLAGSIGLLTAGAGMGAAQAYGDVEVTRLDVWSEDLPRGLDGLKVVHLTDLHAGPLVPLRTLRRWRILAEREQPDLLLFTGDFVDSLPEEMAPLLEAFRDFPAPLGRFAVLGNHDYFQDPRPIWEGLQAIGVGCLENRSALVERGGARLAILGLQDPMARNGRFQGEQFGPGPDPETAAEGIPEDAWRIGLTHRPTDWRWARRAGARLTLAGHTHGGQINLVPGVSSARMLGPWTSGLYHLGGQSLYVSRGLGVVGLPLRISAPPELAVLTLRRGEIPALQSARTGLR